MHDQLVITNKHLFGGGQYATCNMPQLCCLLVVEEGDLRLVEQSTVANWQMGRLEVFFQGSWSQVCAGGFGGADANVACRQLGFSAGTVSPSRISGARVQPERLVYPEVAVAQLGCTGNESRLLDCPSERNRGFIFEDPDGCFDNNNAGLIVACVADVEAGARMALHQISIGTLFVTLS